MDSKKITGDLRANELRFAIVASRFNSFVVEKLAQGALDALTRHGATGSEQTLVWVPGALEIPVVALRLAKTKRYHGIICLGAVIKGQTYHFDYVAGEACAGLTRASLETGIPMTNGILTVETLEQAIERAGATMGNVGYSAALAAIETANVLKQVD